MLEHLLKGGPLMVPLILCSLISLAVVYDRWFAFRENRKVNTPLPLQSLPHLIACSSSSVTTTTPFSHSPARTQTRPPYNARPGCS